MKIKLLITLLLCTLVLSACTTRWAFNNLDWLVLRGVNEYVSLTDAQEEMVRVAVASNRDWLCATQIPRYVETLEQMQATVDSGAAHPEHLRGFVSRFESFWNTLQLKFLDDTVAVLSSLSDEQVAELLASIDAENDEVAERRQMEAEEAAEARFEDMMDVVDRDFGDVNERQEALIEVWSKSMRADGSRVAYLKAWRDGFADALAVRKDPEKFRPLVARHFIDLDRNWPDAYRVQMEHNLQLTMGLLSEMLAHSSADQREHYIDRFDGFREDLDALRCEMPA